MTITTRKTLDPMIISLVVDMRFKSGGIPYYLSISMETPYLMYDVIDLDILS